MNQESFVDVLIIGAGPSGLMAANALRHAGVNVRIVDKRATGVAAGQADGMMPRSLEILQSYDLGKDIFEIGTQVHLAAFYNPSKQGDGIELTRRVPNCTIASARYPFGLTLHQGDVEKIFERSMSSMGMCIERPLAPTSIVVSQDDSVLHDPSAYAVKVHLKQPDSESEDEAAEVVNARFVIGTDGARSWTRKALGVALEGAQTDYYWGVIDFVPETDFPDTRNYVAIHTHTGSLMVIPRENDMVRIYVQLDKNALEMDEMGNVDRTKMSADRLLEIAKASFHPFKLDMKDRNEGFKWWTIYRIGQRVASNFSVHERVFLGGDATHTHSPKAAQGMNASMGDTHNLAWKIAQVVHGQADMSLLKTYEFERRQFAQDLILFDKTYATLFCGKPLSEINTDGITHEELYQAYQTFGGFTSGIGICYAPSAITCTSNQGFATGLPVGQRVPPHVFVRMADALAVEIQDMLPANARFKILLFTGDHTRDNYTDDIQHFADTLGDVLTRYQKGRSPDIVTILAGDKDPARILSLPPILRPHWSRVLVDDVDAHRRHPGGGYEKYGIDPSRGAVVVVRPDAYVGAIAPLQEGGVLKGYFDGFLLAQ
ncbi:FAD binding domain-containing protein [Schizophyllum amplum]|uniref:FAD binding domain-containing protein n=1 Tax=Schizophyllum amplum TaxID=97359 RepID=A0A550CXT4_9AGAR|nr:FAD binding domain-containing protein [Auriculariopsis ampla]